ncbi:hypothetical protein AB0K60_27195 [Thermopolyspora sp. NPDC052614]|uniref:trypsin-like serine peptidase n=1 Tax=Thermopolyspora sp. NPDC052614 TaxID=3155682 RepID=UPI0034238CE2
MNTRVKRLVLPLGGALTASALLGASLVTASTASAAPLKSSEYLAKTPAEAYSVAQFWLDANAAALKKAKQFKYDYKVSTGEKLQVKGGPAPDSKPGVTAPTGYGKVTTTKVKNVNLPRTVGKVFWVDGKGQTWWASGSAIHSRYGNLVATAAHNVFDGKGVFDKWVFVPGYYKGKAPWGVYVGKQAWTHYDFSVYEDYDKDYAFVNVYNGFSVADKVEVNKDDFDKWTGDKWVESKEISYTEYKDILDKYGPKAPVWSKTEKNAEKTGPAIGNHLGRIEVTEAQWNAAPWPSGNQWWKWANGTKSLPKTKSLTEAEYEKLLDEKAAGNVLGKVWKDSAGNFFLTQYFVHQWYKKSTTVKYYLDFFYIGKVKDVGTLSKNVGAQGFAWNQKRGKTVFAFGYPSAPHPNGSDAYSGVTQKWSYGKTYTAINTKLKAEESIGLKSAMTAGADGGPFIWQYNSSKRVGYINGVISWFGDQDDNGRVDFVASPYFDGETKAIYDAAANAWSGTIVGKNGEILK